ncbi:membrane protein DedA, SNARE-associated domain [Meinhardsimonia xiamenensis]|jgi:membrane protein DedA with SNARE-associated domain|uniref:Membrane protein DedA, SNARE-associated domain n=1 Tax=Meinhardsimonia xiamenensis TaxID=990712 RepID=A0A1G9BCE3_9RHOB|nr:VTT domain-containing protein [Meinhardsimonia xiamenensis]PRX35031.1 membrane protein DedA with SNARE-associated domain [Meinhardsimonia xiamenensis]SDK37157.1 membrane protein DedA, SNARE-associated domain [Meinhardsimonia xiamenensis]
MTDTLFALIADYGAFAVMVSAFLSCLALPIPTSLMMLAGGALSASGDLALMDVALLAYLGAVVGDQAGYAIGRIGGAPLLERLARKPARAAVLARARRLVDRHGGVGVFFSTWAVAPFGPWVNFAAGATGLAWRRFAIWDALGEVIWVALYVGLGFAFASHIEFLASLMGNLSGLLAALVLAAGAALWIRAAMRARAGRKPDP